MVVDSKSWAPARLQDRDFPWRVRCPANIRHGGGLTKWLLAEIGIADRDWRYMWLNGHLYFKTEEDRFKFILRWL